MLPRGWKQTHAPEAMVETKTFVFAFLQNLENRKRSGEQILANNKILRKIEKDMFVSTQPSERLSLWKI
jgi:hypothetical protein